MCSINMHEQKSADERDGAAGEEKRKKPEKSVVCGEMIADMPGVWPSISFQSFKLMKCLCTHLINLNSWPCTVTFKRGKVIEVQLLCFCLKVTIIYEKIRAQWTGPRKVLDCDDRVVVENEKQINFRASSASIILRFAESKVI